MMRHWSRIKIALVFFGMVITVAPTRAGVGDVTRVTFDWADDKGSHRAAHRFPSCRGGTEPAAWTIPTGRQVRTRWVELQPD